MRDEIAPPLAAPQHEPGPRPLPLFLELVRRTGERDPALAAKALQGLRIYQSAQRHAAQQSRGIAASHAGVSLRDCGGRGAPVVLVPSVINPPHVLDLDPRTSLADALAAGSPTQTRALAHRFLSMTQNIGARRLSALCEDIERLAKAEQIDAAARDVLAAEGLAEVFVHRTGHGIGLSVHEEPYIVAGNALTLEPGMAFSVEPGVYFSGQWGARIEDIVVCGPASGERLNGTTRELVVV